MPIVGQSGESPHQTRQILHRAQPRQRAQPLLAGALDQARQSVGFRLAAIGAGVDAIDDAAQFAMRLMPFGDGNRLQPLRGHHQRLGPAQRDAAIPVAARLALLDLILVEAILMMDQRRQAQHIAEQSMRQHRIHRAEIIGQHQIIGRHRLGQRHQPAGRRLALQRGIIHRQIDMKPRLQPLGRAHRPGHGGHHAVMQIGSEGIHQLDAAQLLPARIKAGMEMQNFQTAH
jgi:hypothetical protein